MMEGLPPGAGELVTLENWNRPPHLRWGFLHVREVVPTALISRGDGPVLELEHDPREVYGVRFEAPGGRSTTVAETLDRSATDGFLVLHGGRIAAERYGDGMTPRTTHLLQSVSKSVCGTVAGVVAGRGLLDVEAPVTDYVAELAGTGFEGATVRDVLDMRTGTAYDETYDDPTADVVVTEYLAGWRPPRPDLAVRTVYEQLAALPNARPHGERFEYRSILTELLGWILERATGTRYADLVSAELWSRIGAEHDAEITIHDGITLPDGGMCVTLRDLARFALAHLRDGKVGDAQVIPREWVLDTRHGDDAARAAFARSPTGGERLGWMYRNQWWVIDPDRGVYTALGIHGQFAYVNVPADVVCVKLSTCPAAIDEELTIETLSAFAAIAAELSG
jgi:CubicO group peptidase (beta-lactamase class C family)